MSWPRQRATTAATASNSSNDKVVKVIFGIKVGFKIDLGSRLKTAVPELPKCLAPIAGKSFLEWQINFILAQGVTEIILSLGHLAERVIEELDKNWSSGLPIRYAIERDLLGTGGAIRNCMELFDLEHSLVTNGDTLVGGNILGLAKPLDLGNGELLRMGTVAVDDSGRFGRVNIDTHGRVVSFLEKTQIGPGRINAGFYHLHQSCFASIHSRSFSLEQDVFPNLTSRGAVYSYDLDGPFIDIGIPDDYHFLANNFSNFFNAS